MELQGRLETLTREGLGLVAVSYDPVPVLADFTSRRGITFPLLSDLEIDPSPQAAAALKDRSDMTISATLTYQACDDKVCFTPRSVPLTWTIGLRALDRDRANPRQ